MTEHDQYYQSALSWVDQTVVSERRMRRMAWMITGGSAGLALVLAITVALLVPLKTVQPYVVTVDRQSGAVEVATTVAGGQLTQNEAVIQAELANYVRVRETFDSTDLATNYRRVGLRSSPDVRSAYVAAMASDNPNSPLRTLSPGDTVAIKIKSVSILGPGTALVRYDAERRMAGARGAASTAFVSAISYGFSGGPLRLTDRFDNPLGFQVTRYRRDADGISS